MNAGRTIGESQASLRERVLDEFRSRIVNGHYKPGERLTEERLCSDFGVSRSPVREALQVLQADGFVEKTPRRGVVVATPDVERISDLLALRSRLEGLTARLTARRATPAQKRDLQHLLERSAAATEAGDLDEVSALNSDLHLRIMQYSGIRWLASMSETLYLHVQWVFRVSAEQRAPHSWREHITLVEAIVAGDEEAAEAAALHHVAAAEAAAMGELEPADAPPDRSSTDQRPVA